MDQKKTGAFIAQMRKEKGLTQAELADLLLISDKTVSKWETGKGLPEVSLMLPLCETLGISVNELLTGAKLSPAEYQKNAEANIVKLVGEKGEAKFRLFVEVLVIVSTILTIVQKNHPELTIATSLETIIIFILIIITIIIFMLIFKII